MKQWSNLLITLPFYCIKSLISLFLTDSDKLTDPLPINSAVSKKCLEINVGS